MLKFFSQTGSHQQRSLATHKRLVQKIERMSKLVDLILIRISASATIVPPLLIAFINYAILCMGIDSFHFEGTLWFPFDTNQPIGFFMAIFFQGLAASAALYNMTTIVCIYIGSCWSIVTFLRDIARDISHLRKKKLLDLNKRKLTEYIRNFVRFHADVEE